MKDYQTILSNEPVNDRSWEKIISKYNRPDLLRSIWQICNSLIPYLLLWYLMVRSIEYSYWITIALALVSCGFLIRLFIIFHDCGHGSFFKSKRANTIFGMIFGILTFTPYHMWHYQHRVHHATAGNLDKRGVGDVWTMTVDEYLHSSKAKRFLYRAFRNPLLMLSLGPAFMILFQNRVAKSYMTNKERGNIYFTNFTLILMAVGMSLLIGVKAYLLIQLPIIFISTSIGLWLFYVQHQFDEVYWDHSGNWDYKSAALEGSSYLKLPKVLQWFTGNIGFHHIHHLSPRIPNYNLERCHRENELFREIKPLRLFAAIRTLTLNLWDESSQRMISFRNLPKLA